MYGIFAMMVGTGVFGNIISSMTNILAEGQKEGVARAAKQRQLNAFMTSKSLPYSLQVRIRRFFRFYWQHTFSDVYSEEQILEQLSTPLRLETLKILYGTLRSEVPMFTLSEDENYRNALLRAMKPVLLEDKEVLMMQGQVGDNMYLITHGSLEVTYTPHEGVGKELDPVYVCDVGPGDHVGEIALFDGPELKGISTPIYQPMRSTTRSLSGAVSLIDAGGEAAAESLTHAARRTLDDLPINVRTATVTATSPCELYAIRAGDFKLIFNEHTNAKRKLLALAKRRAEKTSTIQDEADDQAQSTRLNAVSFANKLKARRDAARASAAGKEPSKPSKYKPTTKVASSKNAALVGTVAHTTRGLIGWQQQQRDGESQSGLPPGIDHNEFAKLVAAHVLEGLRQQSRE